MKKIKRNLLMFSKVIPTIALTLGISTVSQACVLWFYQPKVPEKLISKVNEKKKNRLGR